MGKYLREMEFSFCEKQKKNCERVDTFFCLRCFKFTEFLGKVMSESECYVLDKYICNNAFHVGGFGDGKAFIVNVFMFPSIILLLLEKW